MYSIIALLPLAARIPLVLAGPPVAAPSVPVRNDAPAPTAAMEFNELGLRDVTDTTTLYIAPDETCGFFGANEDRWLTCNGGGWSCVYVATAGSGGHRNLACCTDFHDCLPPTTCLDQTAAYSSGVCDESAGCSDWQIDRQKICTNSSLPYCKEVTVLGVDATAWDCVETEPSAVTTLETTFIGQERQFITTVLSPSSSTTSTSDRTEPSIAPSGGVNGGSDEQTSGDESGGGSNNSQIGAIVGGTVGGVAVLAIAGLAIFFLVRKKKKDEKKAAQSQYMGPSGQPLMNQPTGYGGSPGAMHDNRTSYMPYANQQPGQYGQPQQGLYPQGQYPQQQQPYSPSNVTSTVATSPSPMMPQHTGQEAAKPIYEADAGYGQMHEMDAAPAQYR